MPPRQLGVIQAPAAVARTLTALARSRHPSLRDPTVSRYVPLRLWARGYHASAGLKEAKDVIDGLRGDLGLTRRR